jgi:hypothetical protein
VTIGVPLLFYLAQSIQYAIQQGRYGMAICFAAYALANLGLILDSKGI